MNKQKWLSLKKTGQYPIEVFWEFFKEHNTGKELTFPEFNQYFQMFIHIIGKVPLTKIINHYDNKFAITKLIDLRTRGLIKEY